MVMTAKEKELTAYHEAGRISWIYTPGNDPFIKLPLFRGRALGVTITYLKEIDIQKLKQK